MRNIEILALAVLAVTLTVESISPTNPRLADTTLEAPAVTTPVTCGESVTHEVSDNDVSDALSSRLGRILPSSSPQTTAKTSPSAVALAPHSKTEATVQKLADTTVPQGDEVVKATLQEEVNGPNYQAVDTTDHQGEVDVAAIQRDGHTLAHEVNTAAPEEKVGDANSQEVTTITSGEVSEGDSSESVTIGNSGRVPIHKGQLVKCFCGGQEVLTSGGCQKFQAGTFIDGEIDYSRYITKSVADLNVVVHDLYCDLEDDHREMKFTKGQFYLRKRGDVVLLDAAGSLSGLRINNYCVTHYLDDQGDLTWVMKACIPPPVVPTCCPPGQALKDGECHPARTPDLLTPLMAAGPYKDSIVWPVIRNEYKPVTCTSDPLKTIPLPTEKSYLIALPTGALHTWYPPESSVIRKFTYPSNYCVDAQQNLDGSVKYYANLCHSDPEEVHRKICDGSVCVRKCCKVGETFNPALKCIFANATFEPPFKTIPHYKTVIGYPLCAPQIKVEGIFINKRGYLAYKGRTFPSTDYCVEKLSDANGKVDDVAIACIVMPLTWSEIREIVFPICQVISLIFLSLTVLFYCMIPVLLQKGGWYQLCHVLSLMVAYSSQVTQHIFVKTIDDISCITIALVMQFSFLSAFFWLSVLCYEVWRKIRSLNRLIPTTPMPFWVYPLFAFGGPFTIGVITAGMQYLAPDNVPGVIKPYIGVTKCWFIDEIELLLYFYGPIAFLFVCNIVFITHTYWNYKKIEDNSAVLRDMTNGNGNPGNSSNAVSRTTLEQRHRRRNYVTDFKQQFFMLVLMSSCWVAEVLSWKIPPLELWALTDVLNTLQGFFIFVIFIANRSKRRHLKERFPELFMVAKQLKVTFQKVTAFILCKNVNVTSLFPLNIMISQVSRKLSSSSVVSSVTTLSQKLTSTSSSFHVTSLGEHETKRYPTVKESENDIITLSHSQLYSSSSIDSDTSC